MKMRPKIDTHDYETKKGHVVRFLRQGAKVKVTIMFRGRETARSELGTRLLDLLADDVRDIAKVETPPKLDGRNMTMVLTPLREAIIQKPAPEPRPHRERRQEREEKAEATVETETEETEEIEETEEEESPARPIKVTRAEGG
jgi:translation initiation factor IF-3